MLIVYNPRDWQWVTTHRTCSFHRAHPGLPYAGCVCESEMRQTRVEAPPCKPSGAPGADNSRDKGWSSNTGRVPGGLEARIAELLKHPPQIVARLLASTERAADEYRAYVWETVEEAIRRIDQDGFSANATTLFLRITLGRPPEITDGDLEWAADAIAQVEEAQQPTAGCSTASAPSEGLDRSEQPA